MKSLELTLKERLLIVEPKDLGFPEEKVITALVDSEKYIADLLDEKRELQFICKGSKLTEEIARTLVKMTWFASDDDLCRFKNYDPSGNGSLYSAIKSFISAVESKGWFWGENPVSLERERVYRQMGDELRADGIKRAWQEAESRTFNPSKTLIFKIL